MITFTARHINACRCAAVLRINVPACRLAAIKPSRGFCSVRIRNGGVSMLTKGMSVAEHTVLWKELHADQEQANAA